MIAIYLVAMCVGDQVPIAREVPISAHVLACGTDKGHRSEKSLL
jgi:hypothetical protein